MGICHARRLEVVKVRRFIEGTHGPLPVRGFGTGAATIAHKYRGGIFLCILNPQRHAKDERGIRKRFMHEIEHLQRHMKLHALINLRWRLFIDAGQVSKAKVRGKAPAMTTIILPIHHSSYGTPISPRLL